MSVLRLGVVDIPYVRRPTAVAVNRAAKGSGEPATTGSVAQILEDRYHVMEVFYETHAEVIGDQIANSIAGAIETLNMGGTPADPFASAAEGLREQFHDFISSAAIEGLGIPGVPTKAALEGVNHRLKSGRGLRRPSFRDTGLYQASFRAWTEQG
ncbi:MAG: hypothetical protein B7Z69_00550 [Actinobacteria bacterium 21-73-9]|nr:MAG: hypothetical protein B7Z69_00550 [Actinobacteria bacterium 21-73-9]